MWIEGFRGIDDQIAEPSFFQSLGRCPLCEPIWGLCFWLRLCETSLWCRCTGNNWNREEEEEEEAAGTWLSQTFFPETDILFFEGCIGFKQEEEGGAEEK